jgi:type IV pilus assembly protein PilA
MLSSIKQRMDRNEDEGFTLIELMVVLLIIAILLAIAIPTFLGARNTANARSTQENLRNALTAEQTNWTSNQTFANSLSSIESSLNWQTGTVSSSMGGNAVGSDLFNWASTGPSAVTTGSADSVELYAYAKDGNCYYIYQSNNPTASYTAYGKQTATSGACSAVTTSLPSAAPTAGTSASTTTSLSWSASF